MAERINQWAPRSTKVEDTETEPTVQVGDVVLQKDGQEKRNDWPIGLVNRTFPSDDARVRQIKAKVVRKGEQRLFLRPINEVALLVSKDTA